MIAGSISRRYARAMLAIGVAEQSYEKLGVEIAAFADLIREHRELADTLANPSHPLSRRKAIVQALCERLQPSKPVRSLLSLLVDRGRIGMLPDLAREYRAMADEHAGLVRAEVVSAAPLDGGTVDRLRTAIMQLTDKQVILDQRTDPELIAGMVTKVGSIVYDGSLKTRIAQMKSALLEGGTA
jgi:F-type H+-transporting ATPase subunit delta